MTTHLACLLLVTIAQGAFIEIPTSQTINVGELAEFKCSHVTADTIRWRVNGSLVSNTRPTLDVTLGTITEGGVLLNVLTILGRLEYNGTEVVAVARFDNGSPEETSNPAAILHVSMNTAGDNSNTMSGFVGEPLSLNVTVGEEVIFQCEHRSADSVSWRINGTNLNSRSDLHNRFIDENVRRFHTLTVTALAKYNTTVIQCVAFFISSNSEQSAPAILQIQGAFNKVDIPARCFDTLSWKAPFSLNLTNVEPDIAYCVDVYNITCGGREPLISDCNVNETSYTSDAIAPDGYIYEYIVTPRSNVEGAQNGTSSQPLRGDFPNFNESSTRLSVGNFGQDSNIRAYQTELTYTTNLPVPSSYSLSLQSLDDLEDLDHVETNAIMQPSRVILDVVSGLPYRRLWNCTILAYGCQENDILNIELSTHDFRNIVSSSLQPGVVRVTGTFTDDSTASGLLVIVIGDSEVIYHKASRDGSDKIKERLITGLAGGEYSISVFVVEENGLPFERVATSPRLVAVERNDVVLPSSSSIEYALQSTSTGVCITCTFLDSSATDCVAVVHQRISQLSSSGLMNIESSHKFTKSGDTASGCIEGVNMEDNQVGVVSGQFVALKSLGVSCFRAGGLCTIGIIVAILVMIIISVFVTILLLSSYIAKRRVNSTNTSEEVAVDMKHCAAYEITSIARKKVVMETNPAYEQVRVNVN